ncbi:MAG: hypothetical protein V1712_03040 [Patescibacteria group bacterium]
MTRSEDSIRREDRFNESFKINEGVMWIPPQDRPVEEILKGLFVTMQRLQKRLQAIFDASQEKEEQVSIALYIEELQKLDLELKENKYAIYIKLFLLQPP